MLRITSVLLLLLLLGSCKYLNFNEPKERPLARVYDKYLYPSDIKELVKNIQDKEDSVMITRNYVSKWIKTQLLLKKAELNLTDLEKEVEKQIENYKNSLIIYRYKQSLINEKLDTVIKDTTISEYYENNKSNFILGNNIVKCIFIRTPLETPHLDKMSKLYKSNKEEDIIELDKLCIQFAENYDYFNDEWIYFNDLITLLPLDINNQKIYLKYNKNIELQDSIYKYLVYVKDYKLEGDIAPIEFVEDNIKNIILNKRKVNFSRELENEVFLDAQNKGVFEVY